MKNTVKSIPKLVCHVLGNFTGWGVKKSMKKTTMREIRDLVGYILSEENVKKTTKHRLDNAKDSITASIGHQILSKRAKKSFKKR